RLAQSRLTPACRRRMIDSPARVFGCREGRRTKPARDEVRAESSLGNGVRRGRMTGAWWHRAHARCLRLVFSIAKYRDVLAEGATETRKVSHRAAHLERPGCGRLSGPRYDPGHARCAEGAARERHERLLSGRLQARGAARAAARASEHHADPRRVLYRRPLRDLDAAR